MKRWHRILLAALAIVVATGICEWALGRLPFGPDGRPGLWTPDVWSPSCSQRIADAYSFSHIGHGIVFFAVLWLVARRLRVGTRYLIAVLLESGWELLENSPLIINRYREATIAVGYCGDSILNSMSDILMMSLGFFLAWKMRPWASLALLLVMEAGCALWVRDNLLLNVIMLIHPVDAIKVWQSGGH